MSLLLNILWIFLGGGLFLTIGYLIGGLFLCLTIIGIPFGVQLFKLSLLALCPFGKTIVGKKFHYTLLAVIMNILWILLGGFWISIIHLVFGILNAITIIGLPFATQHLKLAAFALTPFGTSYR